MKGERLGEFEEVVLLAVGVLRGTASAVAIRDTLRARAAREATLSSIYGALDRLERKGWVRSEVRAAELPEERRKRFYDLTPEGIDALAQARSVREVLWGEIAAAVPRGDGR